MHSFIVLAESHQFKIGFRHKQQRVKLKRDIRGKVQPGHRVISLMRNKFEKFIVLFVLDLGFGFTPDSRYLVDLLFVHINGERHKIAVFFDSRPDPV